MEQQRQSAEILPFLRPQTNDGEPPGSGNWLARMDKGTRFLAKHKQDAGSKVDDFVVYTDPSTMPVVLLGKNTYGHDSEVVWHDPTIFSKNYRFYTILEVLEPNDGNSDTLSTGPVAGDAQSEVVVKLHEKE